MEPGMDLQSQYNQTLQNTIGQSQQERLRGMRTPDSSSLGTTDWANRGVSGHRLAGFQEVDPSQMPNMDQDTQSFLKPLLGSYQEGGNTLQGYYGGTNPYTEAGALDLTKQAGYTDADTTLQGQFAQIGQKLPSVFGHSLANQAYRDVGTQIGDYQNKLKDLYNQQQSTYNQQQQQYQQPLNDLYSKLNPTNTDTGKQSIDYYYNRGFVPGKDNGDWKWQEGAGPGVLNSMYHLYEPTNGSNQTSSLVDQTPVQTDEMSSFVQDYNRIVDPKGSGTWFNEKDPYNGIDYRPNQGYQKTAYAHAPTGIEKAMPALTMAVLGAMTGGAGYAMAGGEAAGAAGAAGAAEAGAGASASALAGQAVGAALPNTLRTGLNTGNWGDALKSGIISGAGSALGGMFGGDVNAALGITNDSALGNLGSSIIKSGVNLAGQGLTGQTPDWKSALSNLAVGAGSGYLGNLASSSMSDFTNPDIANAIGGGIKGLTGGALKGLFSGQGINGQDLAVQTALGAATPVLGGLYAGQNTTPQQRQTANQLANTTTNTLGNIYRNQRRV